MGDFKKLDSWQAGMALVEETYRVTQLLPAEERYGLKSQMRRAAVSVTANIAEGTARGSDRDLVRFLRIARASACESPARHEVPAVPVSEGFTTHLPDEGSVAADRRGSPSRSTASSRTPTRLADEAHSARRG